jgi:hypothetical protein
VNARLVRAVQEIAAGLESSSIDHLRRVYDEVMAGDAGDERVAA